MMKTFMGIINPHKITQLRTKFNELQFGHKLLVKASKQHGENIKAVFQTICDPTRKQHMSVMMAKIISTVCENQTPKKN